MKVLVVGAGPAGAATALFLARASVDATLVEREGSLQRVFRGERLSCRWESMLCSRWGSGGALESIPAREVES